jgi:hypothetical protein
LEKVRVYYDAVGRTLSVWTADPESEDVCEEADDDTILIKNSEGQIIGFEKLNVSLEPGSPRLTVEVVTAPGHSA